MWVLSVTSWPSAIWRLAKLTVTARFSIAPFGRGQFLRGQGDTLGYGGLKLRFSLGTLGHPHHHPIPAGVCRGEDDLLAVLDGDAVGKLPHDEIHGGPLAAQGHHGSVPGAGAV